MIKSKVKIKTQPTSNHGPSTVVGRDVVPNVPDLIGVIGARTVRPTWPKARRSQPGDYSFARVEESKWDAGDSVLPGD